MCSDAAALASLLMMLFCLVETRTARADGSPDAGMMAPITALSSYMAHVDGARRPPVFVDDGLVIVENFAPYIFRGKGASTRWDSAYRQHAARLQDLKVTFGKAHDFERAGNRIYFVLPTHWQGTYQDSTNPRTAFEESGAWTFVLRQVSGQWRIIAYTWGVTESSYE